MDTSRTASRSWLIALLMLALVAFALLRSAWGTRLDSFTIDEPWHTVAGVSYVRHGDFALNPEHPPLVKLWVGALMPASFVVPRTPVLREKDDERDFVEDTLYRDNDDRAAQARTRLAMWSFHGLLLLALGALLWRALGPAWMLGTLAFLALEPSVGAYLPVVMTDLPVALTLALAAAALGLLLARWQWRGALVLGLALGLALSSKHSALAGLAGLAACALASWAWQARGTPWRTRLKRLAQLGLAGVLALGLLWAQYGFRFHPHADGSDGFNRPMAAKLDDLRTPDLKRVIALADGLQLLPRPYLWGLADTVRAGVEGRGDAGVRLWGRFVPGPPPWYTWPSLIAAKLPLALLAMALLGALALWRLPLTPAARWTLLAFGAMALAYLLSLAGARSAYAGVRHAMPVVMSLALLAGALLAWAWRRPQPAWRIAACLPLAAALAMTAREPRLWEYHNELAGGTANAYLQFDNESLDLGQRYHEVAAFGAQHVGPSGKSMYLDHFNSRPQYLRAPFRMQRRVESIHDENLAGIYDGWFLKSVGARVAAPHYSYDPVEGLQGIEAVARFGNVEIWRGRQERPRARLAGLFGRIMEYVYSDGGDDWALVAKRAQEIIDEFPQHAPAAIELGNAHLRLGDRAAARRAYAGVLAQTILPVEELTRRQLEGQIARLDSDQDLAAIAPLRNAAME
jgi:hypothetical protein